MTRLALLLALLLTTPASAGLRIVDGDTIRWRGERIRILGYDSPEIRGKCQAEKDAARDATRALERLLGSGPVAVVREDIDRWGRTLARVYVAGTDVAALMIESGHGRLWRGRREGWC
ncbi:MAG: thermonuclease family protein [Pseudomonadota bacterium]